MDFFPSPDLYAIRLLDMLGKASAAYEKERQSRVAVGMKWNFFDTHILEIYGTYWQHYSTHVSKYLDMASGLKQLSQIYGNLKGLCGYVNVGLVFSKYENDKKLVVT